MLRGFLQSKLVTVGLILVIGFFALSTIKLQPALVSVRKEIKNVEQKISEIKIARQEAEKLSEYLNSSAYLERQARIKLNYKKPGENVVYIYTAETQKIAPEVQKEKWITKILENKFVKNLESWLKYLVK